jgi:GNAT superfamily N-acetyltransferase
MFAYRADGTGRVAPMVIARATDADLDDLLGLFAGYQTFYAGTPQDDARNRAFLQRFTTRGEAGRILLARTTDGTALGFATLYWTLSSITAGDHVLLNDLFVHESARGAGVGKALVDAAADVARAQGSTHLSWLTALDNRAAQRLYERMGAERSAWFEYELET